MLDRTEGDLDLAKELIDTFIESWPASFDAVKAAVASRDAVATERAAHAIKSAVGLFGFRPLMEPTVALEKLGRTNHMDSADALVLAIEFEADNLIRALLEDKAREALVGST